MSKSLPAVILCGGLGTRLSSVVADRPKCLAEINGRPFLAYLLDQLADAGISDVTLATGYMGNQIRAAFRNCYRGMRLAYSQETRQLGTGGALRLAAAGRQAALVMNGDSYCDLPLREFIHHHQNNAIRNSIVITHVDDTRRFGSVRTGIGGRVAAFEEKSPNLSLGQPGTINAGIYILSGELIHSVPENRQVSLENEVFPRWLDELRAWETTSPFIDIGTPESFSAAGRYLPYSPKRIIFIDRDGTINVNIPHLDDPEGMKLLPGSADAIRLLNQLKCPIAVVSNQAVVIKKACPPEKVEAINARMIHLLAREGAFVDGVYFCPHGPDEGCSCRKPGTGLLEHAARLLGANLQKSFLVGDNWSDIEAGSRIGATTILVKTGHGVDVEKARNCSPNTVVANLRMAAEEIINRIKHEPDRTD